MKREGMYPAHGDLLAPFHGVGNDRIRVEMGVCGGELSDALG